MMNWIEIDPQALPDTAFFELLPGPYTSECWNPGSLFLDEERFGYIEPIVERLVPEYDHYAFIEVTRPTWQRVIHELEELHAFLGDDSSLEALNGRVGFYYSDSEARFLSDLQGNSRRLRDMLLQLITWLNEQLEQHEVVSILGL
jgi:hypothetical protein